MSISLAHDPPSTYAVFHVYHFHQPPEMVKFGMEDLARKQLFQKSETTTPWAMRVVCSLPSITLHSVTVVAREEPLPGRCQLAHYNCDLTSSSFILRVENLN